MKKFFFALLAFVGIFPAFVCGQDSSMELVFTAVNNTMAVQLDSIRIINLTQGGDTTLYYPDTVLMLDYSVNVPETGLTDDAFRVLQNYPNPVRRQTTISVNIPEKGKVSLFITDILGRSVMKTERILDRGAHSFLFTPGKGNFYIYSVEWNGNLKSIKILNLSNGNNAVSLDYQGYTPITSTVKASGNIQGFLFSPGDDLLYVGYSDTLQSGLLDTPAESSTYTFQFATNIPCPGSPEVEYQGRVYNTIQVFSQCWLKENLNVGEMILGTMEQSNNGTIEKYCYNNEPDSCAKYGGLYQWDEMMQYTTQPGTQGICPSGWHIPTDEEWKVLEGAVDSQYGIGDPEWELTWDRGYDGGGNLKAISGWNENGNGADLYGFRVLPAGYRDYDGSFNNIGNSTGFWTSIIIVSGAVWQRDFHFINDGIQRIGASEIQGVFVRCLRNEENYIPIDPVAYWNFNGTPDEQVSGDTSLATIDLSYADSYSVSAGQAAAFNGTTTIVEFEDGDEWMNTPDFTLSFWVKTHSEGHVNQAGDPKGHFVFGLGAFFGFQFEIAADYSWCKLAASYELADGSTASEDLWFAGDGLTGANGGWQGWTYCRDLTGSGGVAALLKDIWAHVTCVYNSITREGILYINGEIMKAQDFDYWPDGDPKRGVVGLKYGGEVPVVYNELALGFIKSRAGTLWLEEPWGNYFYPTANHFGGWLDEVRIFHKALTADEIYLMYQSQKP